MTAKFATGVCLLIAALSGCFSTTRSSNSTVRRIMCEATVVEVESRPWVSTFDGVESGDIVILFRIGAPDTFKGKLLELGVRDRRELDIGGRQLLRGTRFAFVADEMLLSEDVVLPSSFRSWVKNIKILDEPTSRP